MSKFKVLIAAVAVVFSINTVCFTADANAGVGVTAFYLGGDFPGHDFMDPAPALAVAGILVTVGAIAWITWLGFETADPASYSDLTKAGLIGSWIGAPLLLDADRVLTQDSVDTFLKTSFPDLQNKTAVAGMNAELRKRYNENKDQNGKAEIHIPRDITLKWVESSDWAKDQKEAFAKFWE